MNTNFKRNLLIGFGLSLFLLIITAVASYTSIHNLLKNAEQVEHTNSILQELSRVNAGLTNAETGQRGFLLTGSTDFLEPYMGAADTVKINLQSVKDLTIDNEEQQKSCRELYEVVIYRLGMLDRLITKKKNGDSISVAELKEGHSYMERARDIIKLIGEREQLLLNQRTEKMNQFAAYTPWLIIIASALALVITVVFFTRVNADYSRRVELQNELLGKDEAITRRINLTREVAAKISEGDYSVRVPDEGSDGLGKLSVSLNKMAESLQTSFIKLSDKEWLQAGIAGLNDKVLGEYDMNALTRNIIEYVSNYTESQVGAFYLEEEGGSLKFSNGYAFKMSKNRDRIQAGDGLVGQCAVSKKTIFVKDVPDEQLMLSYATGEIKPKNIIVTPLLYERKIVGVLEVASVSEYTDNDIAFLEAISENIGTVINSVHNRKRLQELLEETQSQAEELQAQHGELENMNSELEAHTQKLQASEEELKVQQEELLEANQELEERARLLEEKNQLVFERNLEIQKKAEELTLSTRYKSEFLANMSHELRTPLNSILLLSRLLSENNEKNLNSEQVEYATVILNSGQGLLTLIDEILDLSKIEAGKMDLSYTDVNVQLLVEEMNRLFTPMAKEKNIDFKVQVAGNVPGIIETDKLRLDQVIKNLISNALKFTSKGYVLMDVAKPAGKEDYISITIKDTGIGIPEDKQHVIFEAFRQADGSTRRKYGGTGLGLSISRELTKLLKGELTVKSEPGQGSEFTLVIPVSKNIVPVTENENEVEDVNGDAVPEKKFQKLTEDAKESIQRYIAEVIPPDVPDDRAAIMPGDKVILIVEDDTNFAKSLLEYTRQRKYKGVVTVRGDEAVKLAKQFRPAGILLDIQLPVKDGWEVMEELKNNPSTKHIPVHVMSSFDGRYKSLLKGAVDFMDKPVAFEKMQDIFSKIEYVLNYNPRKVLIVEENTKHARALAYYLETFKVNTEIKNKVGEGIDALNKKDVNCVILDMGIPDQKAYDTLEEVKKSPGLENLPIIIFTGKSLSRAEEMRIKQYADSIVIKTAHSYQRILDEVSLFLHLVEEEKKDTAKTTRSSKTVGVLREVLKGKTVLVADDDIRNIYSLTKSLETYQMNVLSATDGKEALKQLKANPKVDIVLMDMMMPEMDGYESTRQIRAIPKYRNLPVIAVTAKAMTGDREKCINAGASDYITKPVDIDQLLSLLRVWLYDAG